MTCYLFEYGEENVQLVSLRRLGEMSRSKAEVGTVVKARHFPVH